MGVEVKVEGPISDGRAEKAVDDFADEWEKRMATLGASMVRTRRNTVLKVQTPYYRLQVQAKQDPPGWKIHDQGVIYGHWLEGTGSRNFPKTRFKGYRTFRIIAQLLEQRAADAGYAILSRFIGRME